MLLYWGMRTQLIPGSSASVLEHFVLFENWHVMQTTKNFFSLSEPGSQAKPEGKSSLVFTRALAPSQSYIHFHSFVKRKKPWKIVSADCWLFVGANLLAYVQVPSLLYWTISSLWSSCQLCVICEVICSACTWGQIHCRVHLLQVLFTIKHHG